MIYLSTDEEVSLADLDLFGEEKCTSKIWHRDENDAKTFVHPQPCENPVVGRTVSTCDNSIRPQCAEAFALASNAIASNIRTCINCKRKCRDCWRQWK